MTPYTAVDLIRVVNSELGERHQKGEQFQQASGYPRSARTEDERSRWQRVRALLVIRHAEQNPKAGGHA
jgi:hypothetical protein